MNPTCADCKNWPTDGCISDSPGDYLWREQNRVTLGSAATKSPASECPGWRPKRSASKVPTRYRRFAPAGCASPATAAAAVATEATRVLEPLALDGESIADVVGRLRDGARTRDDALDMIRDAHSALDTMPASSAPDCVTPAQRIRYAAHAWLAEREEASRLATLCQDAHDALNEGGAPSPGTPAERIRAAVAALVRARDAAVVEATTARVERAWAQDKVARVVGDLHAARGEHERVVEERDQARVAFRAASSGMGELHQQLDAIGVPGGLLPDRIRALAVERETAREERNQAVTARHRAWESAEAARLVTLVMGVVLAAALVAGVLAALGFIPTLSVA